ncbi:MAG: GNAT family N-acetyltransferase [Parvularculaceae bacterium]|nr:GNAT family N-acetyltransferase [Parvularculaceae bacterium]
MKSRRIGLKSSCVEQVVALLDRVLRAPLGRPSASHERQRDSAGVHVAALKDGAVVGCLALHPDGARAVLRSLAVALERRGAGVGARFFAHAEAWALGAGVDSIEAEARTSAVSFYEPRGFRIEGEEHLGHGVPHRKVRKVLRSS